MIFPRPGQSVPLALALTLACGLTPTAHAGDWFFNKCHSGCADTTVTLPAPKVVIETTAPRVSVEETVRPSRGYATPLVGTAFVPLAMPLATYGLVGGGPSDGDSSQQDNPLKGAHAAEVAGARYAKALAAARSDVEYTKRVLDRIVTPSDVTRQAAGSAKDASEALDKGMKDLSDKLDKLSTRVDAVEKLMLLHDNYLRDKIAKQQNP